MCCLPEERTSKAFAQPIRIRGIVHGFAQQVINDRLLALNALSGSNGATDGATCCALKPTAGGHGREAVSGVYGPEDIRGSVE